MISTNQNLIRYFRNALVSSTQKTIDFKKNEGKYIIISPSEFASGVFPTAKYHEAEKLFKDKEDAVALTVAFKTIKTVFGEGTRGGMLEEMTGVLFVPATLVKLEQEDDTIILRFTKPDRFSDPQLPKLPWIPREFLRPIPESGLTLGWIDSVNDFFGSTTAHRNKIESWQAYVGYCNDFFVNVATEDIELQKLRFEADVFIFLDSSVNAIKALKNLYEDLLNPKNTNEHPLLDALLQLEPVSQKKLHPITDIDSLKQHCGQMNSKFPLADSQREALHHLNLLSDGQCLAVSGPPGTGKTTLLQSVIADLVTKSALAEADAPVIVATSANNQAVTNVVDSFEQTKSAKRSNLEQRWICGVSSFAVYMPSKGEKRTKAEQQGYQCTSVRDDNFTLQLDKDADDLKLKMKLAAGEYFGLDFPTVDDVRKALLKRLRDINKQRLEILKLLAQVNLNDNLTLDLEAATQAKGTIEKKLAVLKAELANSQRRMREWSQIAGSAKECRGFLFWTKRRRKRAADFLSTQRTSEEISFISATSQIDDIMAIYKKRIEPLQSKIRLCEDKLKKSAEAAHDVEAKIAEVTSVRTRIGAAFAALNKLYGEELREDLTTLTIQEFDRILDTNVRYTMFWLAVHYYECRFLLSTPPTPNQRGKNHNNTLISFYKRQAMITPCMVMTLYSLPKNFSVYNSNTNYLYNFIDLLIVDEAGQVSPEIGLPSFALAKKAIVVGDEEQIPPIWGVSKMLDTSLVLSSGVVADENQYNEILEVSGHNCSSSSVMRIAKNACKYSKYGRGLFLSEHRRCYDEIIRYSNELVYNGKLEPCRGVGKDDSDYPLDRNLYPHIGFKRLPFGSAQKGSSRVNYKEAEMIARWLKKHFPHIVDKYKNSCENIKPDEIVAIITPFKAQATLLKNELSKHLDNHGDYAENNIAIGTVHAFQGAERRIVILSTVYGAEDECYFIDANRSLMNVAVSRAKDAFWVFGSFDCLRSDEISASGLLKAHIGQCEIKI